MFKISLGSFNEDLLLYLDEIKYEDSLFNDLKFNRRNINDLSSEELIKAAGAYKSHKVRNPQGGLGGVGVETWILQHGGSLYDAAVSFLEVADSVNSFTEFKEVYSVLDFGKDHMSEEWNTFPYDDFVDNMDSNGYARMRMALREYVNNMNQNFGSVGLK